MGTMTQSTNIYGFRVGPRNYPREIAGPFSTAAEAREAAAAIRDHGQQVGRIMPTTSDEFQRVVENFRRGIISW